MKKPRRKKCSVRGCKNRRLAGWGHCSVCLGDKFSEGLTFLAVANVITEKQRQRLWGKCLDEIARRI